MLVLARKKYEQVVVGNDIVVTVLDIRGNSVRLGFEAPSDVVILRSELLKNKDNVKQPAGTEQSATVSQTAPGSNYVEIEVPLGVDTPITSMTRADV